MKTISKVFATLAVVLCFASCEKNNIPEESGHEREIFYSVSEISVMPSFSGTTTHLATEAEWDALLDRFCDMTSSGEQVTFCNTHPSDGNKAKATGSNTPNTISTTNRNELKAWMKEMEKAGKTVNVTYNNGTWNGRAYACFNPQTETVEDTTCTGSFVFTSIPVMGEPVSGMVWALRTSTGDTLILTIQGMMLLNENDDLAALLDGYEVTLSGTLSSHTDINGTVFFTIELNTIDGNIIIEGDAQFEKKSHLM
ncbi:MAG: hypothetical protein IKG81_07055 [Bacteroidales bacterium]|nr:hypothetical protein [Bacteroidales bacterium]